MRQPPLIRPLFAGQGDQRHRGPHGRRAGASTGTATHSQLWPLERRGYAEGERRVGNTEPRTTEDSSMSDAASENNCGGEGGSAQMQRCTACRRTMLGSAFSRDRSRKSGLTPRCKDCLKKARNSRTPERREAHRQQMASWRQRNPAQQRRLNREWRHRNPEKVREKRRRAYERNPHRFIAKAICQQARRRASMRGISAADENAVRAFVKQIRYARVATCRYCGRNVPKGDRHIDHIMPLAKGGRHDPHNLCCACSSCNHRKHARHPHAITGQLDILFAPPESRGVGKSKSDAIS